MVSPKLAGGSENSEAGTPIGAAIACSGDARDVMPRLSDQ
jgi:hypothetical protein